VTSDGRLADRHHLSLIPDSGGGDLQGGLGVGEGAGGIGP
jgi:hypothetical protein